MSIENDRVIEQKPHIDDEDPNDSSPNDSSPNDSSPDDSKLYEELYAMSTKKKIALLCNSKTDMRKLTALKNTGFKINPIQFDVIFKSFSVKKEHHKNYIKILMDMGLDVSHYKLEKMLIEQKYDMGIYHESFNEVSIIAQLIDHCEVNSTFSFTALQSYNFQRLYNASYYTIYTLDLFGYFIKRCSSANTDGIGLLILFIREYESEETATEIFSALFKIITNLYQKGADLNEPSGYIGKWVNVYWMVTKNLIEIIIYDNNDRYKNIDLKIIRMKLLLHILNLEGYKYKATNCSNSAILNLIRNKYDNSNKKKEYGIEYDELLKSVFQQLITKSIIDDKVLNICIKMTITNNDNETFAMLLGNYNKKELNSKYIFSKYLLDVALYSRIKMTEILLDYRAEIDYESIGDTSLKIACRNGDLKLAQFLIERGADPLKWSNGFSVYKSILQTAQSTQWRNDDLVNYLLKHIATLQ